VIKVKAVNIKRSADFTFLLTFIRNQGRGPLTTRHCSQCSQPRHHGDRGLLFLVFLFVWSTLFTRECKPINFSDNIVQ
jgi:hypothetical protein